MDLRRRIALSAIIAASSAGMVALLVAVSGRGRTGPAGPQSAVELNRRANGLAAAGDATAALALLRRAEDIDPALAPTFYNRGRILHRLGRHGDALASYDRALELRPDYAKALVNRAIILARLGDGKGEQALADLTRAIELAPGRTAAYYQRARIRLRNARAAADYEAARADLDRLIELDPGDEAAYRLRAEAAEALGDADAARRDRERAQEIAAKRGAPDAGGE